MDCKSFELMANSSKKIEISFQSDFTVTRITRPLTLKTNLTYEVTYTLVAQLPSKGLEQCEFLLSRPPWEEKIRNAAMVMLLVTFVLVLIAVHIDYGNIMYNQSALYEARDKGTVHPTFNLRNIAMRSSQNNNDSMTTMETNPKNKAKGSIPNEKSDNSSYMLGLKKRNVKNSKVLNGETKSSSPTGRSGLTLADMVSWTFGTKTSKKTAANNNNKNSKATEQTTVNNSTVSMANEVKTTKSKFTEKSLIEKMDGDLKKSQISKKSKTVDKAQNKNQEKLEVDEVKFKKEDNFDKDVKKEKHSPKMQTKTSNSSHNPSSPDANTTKDNKEKRKSLELSSQTNTSPENNTTANDKIQQSNSPKEQTNGRKIGKTPGRERRKQSVQNTSPVISDLTGSSCSSSTSSSCSSNHNNTGKRNERKTKVKASNSLKFTSNNSGGANNMFPTSSSASSSPTSLTSSNIMKTENFNTPVDILSPWDSGNHASFSDVLQKSQQQSTTSTDLMQQQQQGSLFDLMNHSPNGMDNSEITAALTPKRPKNNAADLGPIGSRKSPSSTPVWEPIQQSAIQMQLPRPLNTTSTATSSSSTSSSSAASCYYPMNSTFGYNDLSSLSTTNSLHQHAQLLALQRQLLEQQHLQQQQQQFLNSNALNNNNWSNISSPLWSPILGNGTTTSSSIFPQTQTQNSTWSLTPNSSSPSSGLVRPPPGLEQNFPLSTSMNSHSTMPSNSVTSSGVSSGQLAASYNDTMTSTSNNLTQSTADNDNMPMFNLFGGLSSIWNDNWKQSTQQQPPQNQK